MINVATQDAEVNYQAEGDIAFRAGNLEAASNLYQQAIKLTPDAAAWAEYSLAEVRRCQGNLESAILHYTNSLQLDPFSRSPFIQLLFTKVKSDQLDPIAAFYQQLTVSRPRNPWASVRLGDILTKQRKVADAIANYKAASYKLLKNNSPDYVKNCWDSSAVSEPTYIIIGPMKTATSALYKYINQHPKVLPSIKKEIHFFNDLTKLSYGKDWYLSHFPPIATGSGYVTGEASPGYIVNHVHNTVFSMFPKARIIALVRDPIDRAFSHYMHNCQNGFERRSFADAVSAELKLLDRINQDISIHRIVKNWNWNVHSGYILLGLYLPFLQQWYSAFPPEQILIVHNHALSSRPEATMQQVFSFLHLDSYRESTYPKHNVGSYTSATISTELENHLQNFFKPYQEGLNNFLEDKNRLFLA